MFSIPVNVGIPKMKNPPCPPFRKTYLNNKAMSYSNQKNRVEAIEKLAQTQKLISETTVTDTNKQLIEVIKTEIDLIKKAQKDY